MKFICHFIVAIELKWMNKFILLVSPPFISMLWIYVCSYKWKHAMFLLRQEWSYFDSHWHVGRGKHFKEGNILIVDKWEINPNQSRFFHWFHKLDFIWSYKANLFVLLAFKVFIFSLANRKKNTLQHDIIVSLLVFHLKWFYIAEHLFFFLI